MEGRDQRIPISEAIKKGLVFADPAMATSALSSPPKPKFIQETKTCTIKAVFDPITQREIPVSEAIRHGEIIFHFPDAS